MTGRPLALSALALASTASVADSAIAPMRYEIGVRLVGSVTGQCSQTSVYRAAGVRGLVTGARGRVRIGLLTSRMLTHWVVDDNHAQACPEAPRHPHVQADPCANPHKSTPVSYTHLRAHETDSYLVCRLLLEKKKK